MDTERPTGWDVAVSHAIASPQTLLRGGGPQAFFIGNLFLMVLVLALGNMLVGVLWWKMAVLTGLAHLGTMLATAHEVQWVDLWWRYRGYATAYEG